MTAKKPPAKKSPPRSKPYAMTVVFSPEHEDLLARLESKLLDTRANIVRRGILALAEREGLRAP